MQETTLYDLDFGVMLPSTVHIIWPLNIQSLKLLVQRFRRIYIYIYKKVYYLTLTHAKCCQATSTSCDLCSCKVGSCYVQQFRRICIYKKLHCLNLTLGSRSHKMLPSSLCTCKVLGFYAQHRFLCPAV